MCLEEKHAPAFRISAKTGDGFAEAVKPNYILGAAFDLSRIDVTVRFGRIGGEALKSADPTRRGSRSIVRQQYRDAGTNRRPHMACADAVALSHRLKPI